MAVLLAGGGPVPRRLRRRPVGGQQAGQSAGQSGAAGKRLSIATGNTTGVYYVLGGGLADQIGKNLPGYQATAEATGASVENIQRVVRGDSDIAFTLADSAADAVAGKGAFTAPQPIRAARPPVRQLHPGGRHRPAPG